jgi:hypothetical protein
LAENTEWNKPSERKRINRIITLNWMWRYGLDSKGL